MIEATEYIYGLAELSRKLEVPYRVLFWAQKRGYIERPLKRIGKWWVYGPEDVARVKAYLDAKRWQYHGQIATETERIEKTLGEIMAELQKLRHDVKCAKAPAGTPG